MLVFTVDLQDRLTSRLAAAVSFLMCLHYKSCSHTVHVTCLCSETCLGRSRAATSAHQKPKSCPRGTRLPPQCSLQRLERTCPLSHASYPPRCLPGSCMAKQHVSTLLLAVLAAASLGQNHILYVHGFKEVWERLLRLAAGFYFYLCCYYNSKADNL